jgi:hypothetical protein
MCVGYAYFSRVSGHDKIGDHRHIDLATPCILPMTSSNTSPSLHPIPPQGKLVNGFLRIKLID